MGEDSRIVQGELISKIAEMPPLYFWFRYESLGVTSEDFAVATEPSAIGAAHAGELRERTRRAFASLYSAEVPGSGDWRRMVN